MILKKNKIAVNNYLIFILLIIHFTINIAIYFNTSTFYEISDCDAVFDAYYSLLRGVKLLPIAGYFFLTPAYIAFFIHKLTGGGLFYYFIFQIFLSTVNVYIVYKIILYITKSINQANAGALLIVLYSEYSLLGSTFYNHIYETFFLSAFLLLLIIFNDRKKTRDIVFYSVLILLIIYFSMFFRRTFIFIYLIFIFLLLLNTKDRINLTKYAVLAVSSFIILFFYNPYKLYNSNYQDSSATLFWGHTLYGGLGGEGSFVYPENEERYNKRLEQYVKLNKIDTVTQEVIEQFRIAEIKTFIKNEPHKWLLLQAQKVFYTFGSVPQRDGLLMLYRGKIKMPWEISALILQLPYAILLIMFLLSVDLKYKNILMDSYKRIIYFMGLYLIGGICIFSAYQEKYRPVIFVCFFIPVIAVNLNKLKNILHKENRRELIIKLIIILLLFTVWIYQAYQALYIYHDRYFKVVQ